MFRFRIDGKEHDEVCVSMRTARQHAVDLSIEHGGVPVVVTSGEDPARDCLKVTASNDRAARYEALR